MIPFAGPGLIFAVDRKGTFTLFEASGPLGLKPNPAIGTTLDDLNPSCPELVSNVRRALHGESFVEATPLGGSTFELSYSPLRGKGGRISGALAVAVLPELPGAAAEQSESVLQALFRAMTDVILLLDSEGLYLEVAPTNPSLLYRPANQLIGRKLHDVLPKADADTFLRVIREALSTRRTVRIEHSLPIGDRLLWFSAAISPMSEDRVVWFARDITSQRLQEQALRASEERYRQLFENIGDICFVIDREWRYAHVNQAAARIMRPRKGSIIGRTVQEVMGEGLDKAHLSIFQQVMSSGKARTFPTDTLLLPRSLPGKFEVFVHPMPDGLMCIAHDITERTTAEEALKQSEERYHTLFEESGEPLFITALDGSIVDFNQAALDLFGYTRAEIKHIKTPALYANPDDRGRFRKILERDGSIRDFAVMLRRKSGMAMDCLITATVRRSPDGQLVGYQGVIRDITAQKLAADALRESEARFRAIFEGTTFGIAVLDLSGRPLLVNPALESMFAYTADELRGLSLHDLFHPDDLAAQWGMFKTLARNERDHYQATTRCVTRADQTLWAHLTMSAVWGADDKPIYIIGLIEDITERKQAEDSLRDSEERYRRLVEYAPEPIAVTTGGLLVYLNRACARLLGAQEPADLLGRPINEFVHPDYHDLMQESFNGSQVDGEPMPLVREKFMRVDGGLIDVEVVAIPIIFHGREASQVLIHDITEQVRAQENERALGDALQRSATALNSTLDLDEVLALILSSVGQVVPHDAATIMLIEDDEARVVGQHGWRERGMDEAVRALRLKVSEIPNLASMEHSGEPMLIGDLADYPDWVKMPHTEWIRSYAGAPIVLGGETIGYINLDSGRPQYFTEAHAQRLQTFAEHAAIAIRNARLYAELRHHAAELEARNHDLDEFSQTVAHDLKAPLHIILGYSSLLLSDYAAQFDEETLGHLHNIEDYSRKLDEMIEGMLLLAKLRNAESRAMPTNMRALAVTALERFDEAIQARGITVALAASLPTAQAYGPWIEEVFANLIENAIKYGGADNVAPRIEIRGKRVKGGFCRYEVQDNGIGIAKEHHRDLFKSFSRVQPANIKGVGLGLSIVERMITKLGGEVGVESEVGSGSIFWFTLPRA